MEFLGEGSTAHVYLAQSRSDDSEPPVAIKVIDKLLVQHSQLQRRIQQEMVLHAQLSHPQILQVQVRNTQLMLMGHEELSGLVCCTGRTCLRTTATTTWCWSIASAALYQLCSRHYLVAGWTKQMPSSSSARLAAFESKPYICPRQANIDSVLILCGRWWTEWSICTPTALSTEI